MSRSSAERPSQCWMRLLMIGGLCAVIFLIDTLSPMDMAIAVLYGAVVLFASAELDRRGLLLVSGGCVLLTVLSFIITHGEAYTLAATMRAVVAIAAIAITTLLARRNQDATASLRDQAALLDLSHDAIFVRDLGGVITYWSRGAHQLYGWSASEAVGLQTEALLRTRFPCPLDHIMAELESTGQWDGELVHTTRDGRKVVCLSRWSLQREAQGRPARIMETNHDITARKQAEDDLHQARSDIAYVTRLSTLGELATSIAHEVNQPLAAIVTNGEAGLRWLQRDVPDLGEVQLSMSRMISNAQRASNVVGRLRALVRRDAPDHLPLDGGELVEDCLLLLERELANNRVKVCPSFPPDLPRVRGDRVQLQQVVINLVLNAAQAMQAVPEEERVLRISVHCGGAPPAPCLLIEVEDSGPGAPPQVLNALFTPFFTTKKDGIGIGLSISRSIVEAHEGRILATPAEPRGLRMTVQLPIIGDMAAPGLQEKAS
ncbi:ATP-binding protein [Azorhizobium sp. AG788]|uniref:two-component system sensor histidine kinase NtrB n=1 Tax=Azorhizobium sp. AG788 TaxID=2183897 RepID=UPI00105CA9A8|nr:ATP-binding protein [Azorhizobium sp. AG788]